MKSVALGGDPRMTIAEVSLATGIPVKTIHNAVDRLYPSLKRNGVPTYLSEAQVAQITIELKRAHNSDLASSGKVVTTDLEMKQKAAEVMAWLIADRETLREQVAELEPKAAVAERIAGAIGLKTLSEVGKINGIGPHRIFGELEARSVLYRNASGDPLPYQNHIEAGRFVVRERTYRDREGAEHLRSQIYVTGKGEVWIAGLFGVVA